MCIVFFLFQPEAGPGEYKLVVASNRDEFFQRPSLPAHFWETHPGIIGGMDMEPGREEGTWLAMSKNGRFSTLTNVRQSRSDIKADAKARGCLVVDFVRGSESPVDYCTILAEDGRTYNGFNLLTVDLNGDGSACCVGNRAEPAAHQLKPGIYGLSNWDLDTPWAKLSQGKTKFEQILSSATQEELTQRLIDELLSDPTRHFPDPEIPSLDWKEEMIQALSSVCVLHRPMNYGTRTHTVLTVTHEGQVSFTEKNLEEPIDAKDLKWTQKTHQFQLETRK